MKTTISKNITHSILAEPDDIKSVFEFVLSKYGSVKITGTCTDGSLLETTDIQELLAFENLNYRKLEAISFLAFNEDVSEKLLFVIKENRSLTSELHLSSTNDERAVYIIQEITKRLLDMKPSYDWIARLSVLDAIMSLLMALWFVLQSAIYMGIVNSTQATSISIAEYFNRSIFMAIVLLGITYPIEKLKKYLFPKVFFINWQTKKGDGNNSEMAHFYFCNGDALTNSWPSY